jgi:hypothetical protein
MLIIGCDFHTRFQQIAMLDTTTGEITERRLQHETGEAKAFYVALPSAARVGMKPRVTRNGLNACSPSRDTSSG